MPATTLTERIADWNDALAIDAEARLVKNVALAGLHSKNGYHYVEAALQSAAPLYQHKPVFLDHAADPAHPQSRSTRDLVGSIVNPRFEGGRIRGDIRLLDTDSARTFLALVEADAPGVGMSHVVLARRSADGGAVDAIEEVLSVDAVVNPATTTTFHESATPPQPGDSDAGTPPPAATLDEHLAALSSRLEDLEGRLALVEQQAATPGNDPSSPQPLLDALLAESRLPAYARTPAFLQQLRSAPDPAARRALIDERLDLIGQAAAHRPTSSSRPLDSPDLTDINFIHAVKRQR